MSIPKYYVDLKPGNILGRHHGRRPANSIAGPYESEEEAKEAKAKIIKKKTAKVTSTTKKSRSKAKPTKGD